MPFLSRVGHFFKMDQHTNPTRNSIMHLPALVIAWTARLANPYAESVELP
jgi:hypothetical protein